MINFKVTVALPEVSLMNFLLGISKEIKCKVQVVFIRSIIDEPHSSDMQGDQMAGESGVSGSIIDDLHSWDI